MVIYLIKVEKMNWNIILLIMILVNLLVGNMAQREREHTIIDNQNTIMKHIGIVS